MAERKEFNFMAIQFAYLLVDLGGKAVYTTAENIVEAAQKAHVEFDGKVRSVKQCATPFRDIALEPTKVKAA